VFDCMCCLVEEQQLPEHWITCPMFARELKKLTDEQPNAYHTKLNTKGNEVMGMTQQEQKKIAGHFDAIAKTILTLEDSGAWVSRDHIFTTALTDEEPQALP